jgi:hypothetical protein
MDAVFKNHLDLFQENKYTLNKRTISSFQCNDMKAPDMFWSKRLEAYI